MSIIRAVCFDIGDTLVFDDPSMLERVCLALETFHLAYNKSLVPDAFRIAEDHALKQYLQGTPLDDLALQQEGARLILKQLDLPSESSQSARLAEAYGNIPCTRNLHPRALPLIGELKRRGFLIGVISDWEDTLETLLNELLIAPYLDALAVSALVGVTKPHRKLFDAALEQLGRSGQEVMHVGDYYELDVAGARGAGMIPLFFDWKRRRPDADCARVVTFDEMADFLLALPMPEAF